MILRFGRINTPAGLHYPEGHARPGTTCGRAINVGRGRRGGARAFRVLTVVQRGVWWLVGAEGGRDDRVAMVSCPDLGCDVRT